MKKELFDAKVDLLKMGLGGMLLPIHAMGDETSHSAEATTKTVSLDAAAKGNPLMRYRFGVNYVNSRDWFFFWNDFDQGQVARDLDAIASLEVDHFRISLWPLFQPWRNWVAPSYLRSLDKLMRLAGQRKLDVCVSMLNGWITKCLRPVYDEPGRFYTSASLFQAQQLYFRETAKVLKGHSNFLGFDIGNEMNCCWSAHQTTEGDAWLEKIMAEVNRLCPAHPTSSVWITIRGSTARPFRRRPLRGCNRLSPCTVGFCSAGVATGKALEAPCVK